MINSEDDHGSVRVSIGMPVYNGENYIEEAVASVLNQSHSEFELVISDNGSTDRTPEICERFAANDPRVKYIRGQTNKGASWNFNNVFHLSSGEYFKWAAHDDVLGPTFLEACVPVLDRDASVVLVYPRGEWIDEQGKHLDFYTVSRTADQQSPSERFRAAVLAPNENILPIFGLIRRSALNKTQLLGNFACSDSVLLGQLVLQGRFHEVPHHLFLSRQHELQSWRAHGSNVRNYGAWFAPEGKSSTGVPRYRLLAENLNSIRAAPISTREKLRCARNIIALRWHRIPALLGDVVHALRVVLIDRWRRFKQLSIFNRTS